MLNTALAKRTQLWRHRTDIQSRNVSCISCYTKKQETLVKLRKHYGFNRA